MIDLFGVEFAESMYKRNGVTEHSKHRMSKEIAQELKGKMGNGAYLYCLERLSNNTQNPQLWRDVLGWLDETETTKEETNERSNERS
jgi:hypothetical protein